MVDLNRKRKAAPPSVDELSTQWRATPVACKCRLCEPLNAFLNDPEKRQGRFEGARRHFWYTYVEEKDKTPGALLVIKMSNKESPNQEKSVPVAAKKARTAERYDVRQATASIPYPTPIASASVSASASAPSASTSASMASASGSVPLSGSVPVSTPAPVPVSASTPIVANTNHEREATLPVVVDLISRSTSPAPTLDNLAQMQVDEDHDPMGPQRLNEYGNPIIPRKPQTAPVGAPLPPASVKCLAGLSFVLTGGLNMTIREGGEEQLKRYGGRVTKAPSSKTSYVVLGVRPGLSKLVAIDKFGLASLTQQGLLDLIKNRASEMQ